MRKHFLGRLLLLVLLTSLFPECRRFNSTLDSPYDVKSPIYGGNRPVITGFQSVVSSPDTDKMFNCAVRVNWTDSSSNATGYIIQRSPNDTDFGTVGTVGNSTFSFVDSTVKAFPHYYYRISTKTARNVSLPSSPKEVILTCSMRPFSIMPAFGSMSNASFGQGGNSVAVFSNNTIKVIDLRTGSIISRIPEDAGGVVSLQSAAGYLAFSGTWVGYGNSNAWNVYIYDAASGELIHTISSQIPNDGRPAVFPPNRKQIYVFRSQGLMGVYNTDNWAPEDTILVGDNCFDISSDGSLIVYTNGGYAWIQRTSNWSILQKIQIGGYYNGCIATFNYNASRLIVYRGFNFSVMAYMDYMTDTYRPLDYGVSVKPTYTPDGNFLIYEVGIPNLSGTINVLYAPIVNGITYWIPVPSSMSYNQYGTFSLDQEGRGIYVSYDSGKFYLMHFSWEQQGS